MGDEELLKTLREQPEDGMAELVERYLGLVYAVVRSKLPAERFCAADIEACVADTFSEFYCDLAKYDPGRGSVRAWLCVMAKHNAIDLARRRAKDEALLPLDEAALSDESEIDADLEDRELRAELLAAVQDLGEPDREIVFRKFYLAQSSREIGERLGLTAANVDTRTHRAVAKLRERLMFTGGEE